MTPIQQAHVVRWIEALLSGQYKQGCGLLYDPEMDCYCVNGVLAKVAGFPFDVEREAFVFGKYADIGDILTGHHYNDAFLPTKWFKEFTGLPFPPERLQPMNDASATFVALAAYLISYLPDGSEKARLQHTVLQRAGWESSLRADLDRHIHEEAEGDVQ